MHKSVRCPESNMEKVDWARRAGQSVERLISYTRLCHKHINGTWRCMSVLPAPDRQMEAEGSRLQGHLCLHSNSEASKQNIKELHLTLTRKLSTCIIFLLGNAVSFGPGRQADCTWGFLVLIVHAETFPSPWTSHTRSLSLVQCWCLHYWGLSAQNTGTGTETLAHPSGSRVWRLPLRILTFPHSLKSSKWNRTTSELLWWGVWRHAVLCPRTPLLLSSLSPPPFSDFPHSAVIALTMMLSSPQLCLGFSGRLQILTGQ